jgi:hypothetical protein
MKASIFIGSSGATERYARELQQILIDEHEPDIEVIGWWRRDAFPVGTGTLEALEKTLGAANAALFVAAPDDLVTKKGREGRQPRDNVIFEYGLFCGAHGRERSALAVLPGADGNPPALASDFDGITQIHLVNMEPGPAFRDKNRDAILAWARRLKEIALPDDDYRPLVLPQTDAAVREVTGTARRLPDLANAIDSFAADFLRGVVKLFEARNYGYDKMYSALLRSNLRNCNSIYALDVLGPSAWIGPASFRYLSLQLWQYLRANASEGRLALVVSDILGSAIDRALANVTDKERHGPETLHESLTDFDSQRELRWSRGAPVTEYARILMWSKEELLSSIAEPVIAIHEAFHVPLFYLETPQGAEPRAYDYLVIRRDQPFEIFGFVSTRAANFNPEPLDPEKPGINKQYISHFEALLNREDIAFAIDARHYLSGGRV